MLGATKVEDLKRRDPDAPVQRRVVCAANRQFDGTVLLGARHWDAPMRATARALSGIAEGGEEWYKWDMDREEQGFIDQFGVYMDRTEAWDVALAAGQIRFIESYNYSPTKGQYILYSENLY